MSEKRVIGSGSLDRSWSIQERVSARGFDWPDIGGVFAKVREELGEVESAWDAGDRDGAARELGDLLFATVNLGRFLGAHPRRALDGANRRFLRRFRSLEMELNREGRKVDDCNLAELDKVWDRIKEVEGQGSEKGAEEDA